MLYSSRHVASLFNVSRETVRTWANEFARHLSVAATPGEGRHRNFTEDDLRVFSLIKQMKSRGLHFDEIHVALSSGERGDAPLIETSDLATSESRAQLMTLREFTARLEADRQALLEKIRPLEDEITRLKALLENSETQRTDAQQEIRALYEEIGMLKAEKRINPPSD